MVELEDRLRRLADDQARQARAPGAGAAILRGRRRRRRQAAAVAVTLVGLVGALAGMRDPWDGATTEPAAPAPTNSCVGPRCDRRQVAPPRAFEPVEGKVVARGERPGFRWRLVVRRDRLSGGQHGVVALYQHDDNSPNADVGTLEPVELSFLGPGVRDGALSMAGIVTDRAARVRLQLLRGGAPVPPVEVRSLGSGGVFPHNRLFVAFLPGGSVLRRIELLDRRGGLICVQRLAGAKARGGAEACF